ncbi:MAG TPA: V-type ATP synthase subunit D [Chlamydiales bacterium]|nr:V-type ATP synthase subunit D [Chlamydiales bacterium]
MSLKQTKTELRTQQMRLAQFQRYLPTLQLKKSMLQFEIMVAEMEIAKLLEEFSVYRRQIENFSPFLLEKVAVDILQYAEILQIQKRYENIAGVEIPIFENVVFRESAYFLFDTPVWTERATALVQEFIIMREKIAVAIEKRKALQKELREVSIRVNLFEKIMIPRFQSNISKIRIFLGDMQLAAVAQAKVAKGKLQRNSLRIK